MNVVREDVEKLVGKELEAATERFGLHHSYHEKYAVTLEELQECEEALSNLNFCVSVMWKNIRDNDISYASDMAENAYNAAIDLACEAIQVAAMCRKEIGEGADKGTAEISDHGTYTGKDDVRVLHCDACKNDFVSTIRPHPYFCPKCGYEFTNIIRF